MLNQANFNTINRSYLTFFLQLSLMLPLMLKKCSSREDLRSLNKNDGRNVQQMSANNHGSYSNLENVTRMTNYGPVIGRIKRTTVNGFMAQVFLGVPYAQPPIGELRLKYPVPPKPWTEPYDATFERPWCVQFWYTDDRIDHRLQGEDCLHLTIYTPHGIEKSGPYPVLFWIHGGSYQVGGANAFPVQGTIDNLVSRGLIFVVINYRLGALGFMSSLNNNLPGNYGLEDQLLALKFVQQNIHHFDGDPLRITVGGESAGAASVGLLSISPKTKGLFQRAVIRSGSSLAPWSVRTMNTDLNTDKVIEGLGCGKKSTSDKLNLYKSLNSNRAKTNHQLLLRSDEEETVHCLQLKDWTDFRAQWRNIAQDDLLMIATKAASKPASLFQRFFAQNYNHPFLAHTYFTPVIDAYRLDDALLPHYAQELARNNSHLQLLIGSTTGECTGYVTWLTFLEKYMNINLNDLDFVVPSTHYKNAEQVKQAAYKRYIGDSLWKPGFNVKKALVEIASDQNFIAPIAEEVEYYLRNKAKVFIYIFGHGNQDLFAKHTIHGVHDVGSMHGSDMVYLFQSTSVVDPGIDRNITWSKTDKNVTHFLAKTLYNFVATGDPNPTEVADGESNYEVGQQQQQTLFWPEFKGGCKTALLINGSTDVSTAGGATNYLLTDFYPEAAHFWTKTIRLVESLTLRKGYTFEPAPDFDSDHCCGQIFGRTINFKTGFYFLLILTCITCIILFTTCYALVSLSKRIRRCQSKRNRSGGNVKNGTDVAISLLSKKSNTNVNSANASGNTSNGLLILKNQQENNSLIKSLDNDNTTTV